MGIRVSYDMNAVRAEMEQEVRKSIESVVDALASVGDEIVSGIVDSVSSSWRDRTGNLRSSVGYIVSLDGVEMRRGGFRLYDGPERASTLKDGSQVGAAFAVSLLADHPEGLALVIVAGMEYASHVEAVENRTVLAQAELDAPALVEEMIAELQSKLAA